MSDRRAERHRPTQGHGETDTCEHRNQPAGWLREDQKFLSTVLWRAVSKNCHRFLQKSPKRLGMAMKVTRDATPPSDAANRSRGICWMVRERKRGEEASLMGASLQLNGSSWTWFSLACLASVLKASVVWLNFSPWMMFRNQPVVLCSRTRPVFPHNVWSLGLKSCFQSQVVKLRRLGCVSNTHTHTRGHTWPVSTGQTALCLQAEKLNL